MLELTARAATMRVMKFVLSIAVYAAMALALAAGILMAVKGSFWLLGTAFLAYLVLLIKYGCHSH